MHKHTSGSLLHRVGFRNYLKISLFLQNQFFYLGLIRNWKCSVEAYLKKCLFGPRCFRWFWRRSKWICQTAEKSSANPIREPTFPWIWESFKHTDVWNSHIHLKSELDSSLGARNGIHPTSLICWRHLEQCYTWYSPCRETGAVGLNPVLFCSDEMRYAVDVAVPLPGQVREPRKVPSSSLKFTFNQRVLHLLEEGLWRNKSKRENGWGQLARYSSTNTKKPTF